MKSIIAFMGKLYVLIVLILLLLITKNLARISAMLALAVALLNLKK
ncbi:hypothetical protein JYQ62_37565 [Nostoc sp. UHCC 0702]|nr:hypothetical protein JYQ62_37565 [Nostoc sp. UHCC 0702]